MKSYKEVIADNERLTKELKDLDSLQVLLVKCLEADQHYQNLLQKAEEDLARSEKAIHDIVQSFLQRKSQIK